MQADKFYNFYKVNEMNNSDFEQSTINGITYNEVFIYGADNAELNGKFVYDPIKKVFFQLNRKKFPFQAEWTNFARIEIEFIKNFTEGIYREFYKSKRLRREVPFIISDSGRSYTANGVEKIFYEDLDSYGKKTYTILHENEYKNGIRVGIWKTYSIDGGLLKEDFYDEEIITVNGFLGHKYKEYHNIIGTLALIEEKSFGKAYYKNGNIKAEWENKNFEKNGQYREFHENGELKMEVKYNNGTRYGIMNKYYPDKKLKEIWNYNEKGERIFVKKYYNDGQLKTEWIYENGVQIQNNEFDKYGKKKG